MGDLHQIGKQQNNQLQNHPGVFIGKYNNCLTFTRRFIECTGKKFRYLNCLDMSLAYHVVITTKSFEKLSTIILSYTLKLNEIWSGIEF